MQKTILFLCYTLLTINCFSQTTTLDVRIEPESDNDISNDNGGAILAVEDGFLITDGLWCRNDDMCCADCSNLLKIDLDGNLLWQKLYNEFPCQFVLTQASLVKYTDEHLVSAVLQKCSDETNIRAGIIRLNPENGDSLFHLSTGQKF